MAESVRPSLGLFISASEGNPSHYRSGARGARRVTGGGRAQSHVQTRVEIVECRGECNLVAIGEQLT